MPAPVAPNVALRFAVDGSTDVPVALALNEVVNDPVPAIGAVLVPAPVEVNVAVVDPVAGTRGSPVALALKEAVREPCEGSETVPTAEAENEALRLPEPEVMTDGVP